MSDVCVPTQGQWSWADERGGKRDHRHADAMLLMELTGSELLTLRQDEEIERWTNMVACRRQLRDLRAVYGIRVWK